MLKLALSNSMLSDDKRNNTINNNNIPHPPLACGENIFDESFFQARRDPGIPQQKQWLVKLDVYQPSASGIVTGRIMLCL